MIAVGLSHLGTGGGVAAGATGVGVGAGLAWPAGPGVGFEVAVRYASGGESIVEPSCAPGAGPCAAATLVPGVTVTTAARLALAPDPRLRLSVGPVLVVAPAAVGSRDGPALGAALGIAAHPWRRDGAGPGLEVTAARLLTPLGEVRWTLASSLTYRW
jgi:hypothetical protein